MSTKLGTLTLDLVAKIGNFTGPIKEGEKQVKLSFDNMRKHINTYGAVAVAGAAAVGAGVFAMANEYSNAAREVQTFAQIAKAGNEEFQKLAVGANTVGISQEKLSDQLKDFNEKLGEFITIGSGGAVDFFEQIAIKTEGSAKGARQLALEMQNLSGPQALQLYVDKLEEAGVTQQQMSFYLESMASDTTNLIPLLRNGGEGFKYWADAAERAGAIMDEHAIAKANELRVQMDLLSLQVQGAKNQFIQGLMPAIVSVGGAMSDATVETNMMADAGETLGEVFKGVAVVGMGVYATIKMISNAIAGLSFDAVNAKKNVDLAAQEGNWLNKFPGIKLFKSALITSATMGAENSGVSMAAADNKKVAEDVAAAIENIYGDATNKAVKAMAELQSGQNGVIKGSDEWIDKQNKAAKASRENTKALTEHNRMLEEQKRIFYDYSTGEDKLKQDLDLEISRLTQNRMEQYIPLAKAQYEQGKKLAEMQFAWDLTNHRYNEEQKLRLSFNIKEQEIKADASLTKKQREQKLQSLDEQYAIELRKAQWHALEMRQTIEDSIKELSYDSEDVFARSSMSSLEYQRWALDRNRSEAQLGLKNQRVGVERDIMSSDAYGSDDERYQALTEAHRAYREGLAAIDAEYLEQVDSLQNAQYESTMNMYGSLLSQASSVWGDMTQLVKDSEGEQSSAYKAMFLMQQMFAIGSALVSTHLAAAQVMADPTALTMAQKTMYSSLILGMGYANVGLIAGQTIAGMAHDGIDNVPREGTWLLDKGERVVDKRTNADLKQYLSHAKGNQPNINIITPPGYEARQSIGANGEVTIEMVKKEIAYSWSRLQNPNSHEMKSLRNHTTANTKR